jgi:hypothetical protein
VSLRSRRTLLWLLGLNLLALGAICVRPVAHLSWVALCDRGQEPPLATGMRDDASHLEATLVAEVVEVPADDDAALAAIRAALERARSAGLQVSIAGARHSMGGQTIAPGGIVLDMLARRRVEVDAGARIAHAQAGATWHDVLRAVDPAGLSVAVMQSNNVFTGRRLDQRELPRLAARPSAHRVDGACAATRDCGRRAPPLQPHRERGALRARARRLRSLSA